MCVSFVGCSTTDKTPESIRAENVKTFRSAQLKKVKCLITSGQPITIKSAVIIAQENNYELEINNLKLRLAELGQDTAFGSFLPRISLSASAQGTDVSQGLKSGNSFVQMSDQHMRNISLKLQQSIFDPQAWYIYQMKKTGVNIQKNVNDRLMQLISLQVKYEYLSYFILDEQKRSLQHTIAAIKVLLDEANSLVKEGLMLESDQLQLQLKLTSAHLNHSTICRTQAVTKAQLLKTMGLAPDTEITLTTPMFEQYQFGDLPELITHALIARTELFISDQNIDISKNELKRSVAAFLPTISASAGPSYSSDSFLQHATTWNYGLSGVMSIFKGMQNISNYKAAKVKGEQAKLKRDQETLTVILDVVNAHKIYKDSLGLVTVTQHNLKVETRKYREAVALKNEGLIEQSTFLQIASNIQRAQSDKTISNYQSVLAAMTLQDIIGKNNHEITNE